MCDALCLPAARLMEAGAMRSITRSLNNHSNTLHNPLQRQEVLHIQGTPLFERPGLNFVEKNPLVLHQPTLAFPLSTLDFISA
jgi:hypothetical protein